MMECQRKENFADGSVGAGVRIMDRGRYNPSKRE